MCLLRYPEGALLYLETSEPSLIISDVRLPGMNGVDFAERVKADPRFTETPVVLISAFGEPNGNGSGHVADRFLAKPFDFDALTEVLRSYLDLEGEEPAPA